MPLAAVLPQERAGSDPVVTRYRLVWLVAAVYWGISGLTRAVLAAKALAAGQIAPGELPGVLGLGAGFDLIVALAITAPFALYLLALPRRLYRACAHRAALWSALALAFFGFAYLAAVEYFFFDEFNARFNYVAVEYLIYPHEVFVNIWQSYPVGRTIVSAAALAGVLLWAFRGAVRDALAEESRMSQRIAPAVAALLLPAAGLWLTPVGVPGENRVAAELAANGIRSFFSAALTSHLDYLEYYLTLDGREAAERARRLVAQPNATFLPGSANPLARRVAYPGRTLPLNVVVLLEESLGAEFIGAYGDKRGLTPNLDRIADKSLVFTRSYATGTRTVRGMEAVTASFPPVPAEAIVKRAGNEGMFNWSTVMAASGYTPTFIYGGYGTFDNMNYFFRNNGYRVVDRTQMDAPRFSNIWGVSDEDLFRNALAIFDAQHARGERIFSVVMTTSNHKPFTFPAGVPGVAARGGGREAGVRYADYAIGRFVEALASRPYSDDTMVVIVGDHGARVYGREDIPLRSYEIPFIVWSPRHVAPRRVDTLVSQLDVAPTVLGLLGISYDSAFFGKDALAPGPRWALLNHNRDIALLRENQISGLGFRRTRTTLAYDPGTNTQRRIADDPESTRDAASVFQLAYALFAGRSYRTE